MMEESFEVSIFRGSQAANVPAYARIELPTEGDGEALQLSVMAVAANEQLCSWSIGFDCGELMTSWKVKNDHDNFDSKTPEDQRKILWNRLKIFLNLGDPDDDDAETVNSSLKSDANSGKKRVATHWSLKGDDFDNESLLVCDLLLKVNEVRGRYPITLWDVTVPKATTSIFNKHMNGFVCQIERQAETMNGMQEQLDQAARAIEGWKDTAEHMRTGWEKEKQPLLNNFLKLYKVKQEHISELQDKVKVLEKELEAKANWVPPGSRLASARRPTKQEPLSDEESREAQERPRKRRNKATGAIEYLDSEAVFEDETLFPNRNESDNDESSEQQKEDRFRRAQVKSRNQKKPAPAPRPTSKPAAKEKDSYSDDGSVTGDEDDEEMKAEQDKILQQLAALEKRA